jgi:hypothetical protein
MKIYTTAAVLILSSSLGVFAKPIILTRSEMISKATVIAIVRLEEPKEAQSGGSGRDPFAASGDSLSYSQQANVHVEKLLKGKISNEFTLYGEATFEQAPSLSKGRFLVFLSQDGELWACNNWQLSLRPIKDTEVEWYESDEARLPMQFQKLQDVVLQVEAALEEKKAKSE